MYAASHSGVNSGWQAGGSWTVSGALAVTADSVTPSSGSGASQTFQLQYSSTAGFADLATLWVFINAPSSSAAADSCLIYYETSTQLVYLINDAGTAWKSGLRGSAGTLQNSQCRIQLASTLVMGSGDSLTLHLPVLFTPAFAGMKAIAIYGAGSGSNSGWQTRGSWTATGSVVVTADSASPNAGAGASQLFSFTYADSAGFTDFATSWVWFNAALGSSAANSCLMYYERSTSTLFLLNDAGTDWTGGMLNAPTVLLNSQCRILLSTSTVQGPPNSIILNLSLEFEPTFAGTRTIFMYAASNTGANSGWQARGSWTIP
jgi:hypothetical protein